MPKTATARKTHTCSEMSGQKGVVWDRVQLGSVSDSELARELGVTSGAVRKARLKRGIPLTVRQTFLKQVLSLGAGEVSDTALAITLRKSRSSVSGYRRTLGLSGPMTVDWDNEPLGMAPDRVLAKKWGVGPSVVGVARRHRGIPRGDHTWITTEGVPANYPEACIDLWFHEQGIPHSFQVKLGRYIADWVLGGTEVVEYAGFENHRVLGARYSQRLAEKSLYYTSLGLTVRIIRPADLCEYMPTGTPGFRSLSKSCVKCETPFSAALRHHAKGACGPCYRRPGGQFREPIRQG